MTNLWHLCGDSAREQLRRPPSNRQPPEDTEMWKGDVKMSAGYHTKAKPLAKTRPRNVFTDPVFCCCNLLWLKFDLRLIHTPSLSTTPDQGRLGPTWSSFDLAGGWENQVETCRKHCHAWKLVPKQKRQRKKQHLPHALLPSSSKLASSA